MCTFNCLFWLLYIFSYTLQWKDCWLPLLSWISLSSESVLLWFTEWIRLDLHFRKWFKILYWRWWRICIKLLVIISSYMIDMYKVDFQLSDIVMTYRQININSKNQQNILQLVGTNFLQVKLYCLLPNSEALSFLNKSLKLNIFLFNVTSVHYFSLKSMFHEIMKHVFNKLLNFLLSFLFLFFYRRIRDS